MNHAKKAKRTGPLPGLSKDLYLRGIPKSQVQINGPKMTIDKFNAFCQQNELTKWEAIEVMMVKLAELSKEPMSR